jgi:hypothetical protein
MSNRFPSPWSVVPIVGGFCVKDAKGQPVAFTFGENSRWGMAPPGMTMDEAKQIAVAIAGLPDFQRD